MANTSDSRTYDIKNSNESIERLYRTRTDLIETPSGESFDQIIKDNNDKQDAKLEEFKNSMSVKLTGDVTGTATGLGSEMQIEIPTKMGNAYARKVKLTGDVAGEGEVNTDGVINIKVTGNNNKAEFPVNGIQWSTSGAADSELAAMFGGTWECMGNIDCYIGGSYDLLTNSYTGGVPMALYIYKKTEL